MALIIMGSSGGRCGRSGSALPDITMHAGGGARGASRSAAKNMRCECGEGKPEQCSPLGYLPPLLGARLP